MVDQFSLILHGHTHLTALEHGRLPVEPAMLSLDIRVPVLPVSFHERLLQLPTRLLQLVHVLIVSCS